MEHKSNSFHPDPLEQDQLSARSLGYEDGDSFGLSMRSPRESTSGSLSARSANKEKPAVGNLGGDEEAKDLPPEEFKDFFATYDQDVVGDSEGNYLSLDDALK